jgi:two-component system phosphate regulon response regulator OmpR
MADDATHILVVDDDDRLRDLLKRYLSECGYRVSVAANAEEARASLGGLEFDLIVMDLMMPGETGLELTEDLRRTNDVPILLLTAMGEAVDRISGLEVGADDYLPKPFEPRELALRIEAILRRAKASGRSLKIVEFGDCSFDIERGELLRNGDIIRLTSNEVELLRTFSRNPGMTIDRDDLTTQSGGNSLRAVDVQINRLRRKIEPDPKEPRYLQTVWGRGYVLWLG